MIIDNTIRCLLQINACQLLRNPASEMIILNIPTKHKNTYFIRMKYRIIKGKRIILAS